MKKFGGRRVSPLASPRWVSISTSRASCAAGWLATARSCTCRLIVEAEAASLSSNKAAKHHEGSDRVSWSQLAISRAVAVESSRGWRITKEKQAHKIDMVVALGMAALAVKAQSEHTYNWRGDWISGPGEPPDWLLHYLLTGGLAVVMIGGRMLWRASEAGSCS